MTETAPHTSPSCIISIIIPALNEERLIMRLLALFTPERRTKYGFEVIVSDGGSADATIPLVEEALSKGLVDVLVRHNDPARRQTIAEGRNRGAEKAHGEVLIFLNADTMPADFDALCKAVLHWHRESPSIAAATPVAILPEERIWSDHIFHLCMNGYVRLLNFCGIGMGRGECQIVRRYIFEQVGGYHDMIVAGEDFDLYTRLRRRGRIAWLRDALVYESPRRFRKYGYRAIVWRWFSNSIAVLLFKKSVAREWELIRE